MEDRHNTMAENENNMSSKSNNQIENTQRDFAMILDYAQFYIHGKRLGV